MITENLSTLKINKLTRKQYERELAAGRIDENALYLTPESFSGSWDDLTDKPFYEETTTVGGDTLTWDGNTEGLEVARGNGMAWYRISDAVPTKDDVVNGGSIVLTTADGDTEIPLDYEMFQIMFMDDGFCAVDEYLFVVPYDNYNNNYNGFLFAKSGIYSIHINGSYVSRFTINGYDGFKTAATVVKPIDTKYLPEHLQFGETTVKGDTLTWDGNTDGLYTVGDMFVKISDATPTKEDFVNGCIRETSDSGKMNIEFENVTTMESALCVGGENILIIPEDNSIVGGMSFEEAGVYTVINHYDRFVSLTIPNYGDFEATTTTPLDEKFIPDTIARVSDIPTVEDFINALPIYNGEVEEV